LRIFLRWWNYNGSLYHWLEAVLSGNTSPGAAPVELVGSLPGLLARGLTGATLALVILWAAGRAWRARTWQPETDQRQILRLLRLTLVVFGAYLLLAPTVHPWYLTLVLPFTPFLFPYNSQDRRSKRFLWPWLYLSLMVPFTYLTYLDPDNLREYALVRGLEYLPFYLLLLWAAWPWLAQVRTSIFDKLIFWGRMKRR